MAGKENLNFGANTAVQQIPNDISADSMTVTELHEALMVGYREMQNSKVQVANTAFARFRDQHK